MSLSFVFIAQISNVFNIACEIPLGRSIEKEKIFVLFATKILCAICCLAFSVYQIDQFYIKDYELFGDNKLLWMFRWFAFFTLISIVTQGFSTYFDRTREAETKRMAINSAAGMIKRSPQNTTVGTNPHQYKILKLHIANATAGFGGISKRVVYKDLILDQLLIEGMGIKESSEAVFVVGDSMQDLIMDGSIALLDQKENQIKNGEIYAINSLDGLFIKQCFIKDGRIELHSLNPLYEPFNYALNEVSIIGRVRGVINKIV